MHLQHWGHCPDTLESPTSCSRNRAIQLIAEEHPLPPSGTPFMMCSNAHGGEGGIDYAVPFGVRRQSGAVTALWLSANTLAPLSKAESRFACLRTPNRGRLD